MACRQGPLQLELLSGRRTMTVPTSAASTHQSSFPALKRAQSRSPCSLCFLQLKGCELGLESRSMHRALSAPAPCSLEGVHVHAQLGPPPDVCLLEVHMQAQHAKLLQQRAEQEEWAAAAQALLAQPRSCEGSDVAAGRPSPPCSGHSSVHLQAALPEPRNSWEHLSQPDASRAAPGASGGSTPPRLSDAHAPLRTSDGCTPAPAQRAERQQAQPRFAQVHSLPLPVRSGSGHPHKRFLAEHSLPLLPEGGGAHSPPHGARAPAPPALHPSSAAHVLQLHGSECQAPRAASLPPLQAPPECGSAVKPRSDVHSAQPQLPQLAGSAELHALNRLIASLQAEIAALEAAEAQRQAQLAREAAKQREWERKKRMWAAEQAGQDMTRRRPEAAGQAAAAGAQQVASAGPAAAPPAAQGAAQQAQQAWEQQRARELAAREQRRLRAQQAQQRQQAQQAALAEQVQAQREAERALQRAWQQHLLVAGPAAVSAAGAAALPLAGGFAPGWPVRQAAPARQQAGETAWAQEGISLDPVLQAPPEVRVLKEGLG